MPLSWVKLITSGSDAELNNITASANISASGFVSANSLNTPLIVGDNNTQFQVGTYEFGYNAFPGLVDITGSGLIVSSSLPSEHYSMIKIGNTELVDLTTAAALTSPTFLIHNVSRLLISSGSEPTDVSTNKLLDHDGTTFATYGNGSTTPFIEASNSSVKFGTDTLYLIADTELRVRTNSPSSSPQYMAVWDEVPTTLGAGATLKYITASTFIGSGSIGTLQQVTDVGNTTSNAISSSFNGVGFYGTASWAINVVNGGGGGTTDTGSLLTTASVVLNTLTFTKGDGSTFDVVVDTGSFTPTDTGSLLVTASSDFSEMTFTKGDGTTFPVDVTPNRVIASIKNISGVTLAKGTPVHVTASASPPSGFLSEVVAADASDANLMPCHYILAQDLDDGEEGFGILSGKIQGVDTQTPGFSEGDTIYVAEGGGYTNVKPTGSGLIQNIGVVTKIDASNGGGEVFGAGRTNDLPNLQSGYTWVGDTDGVPQQVTTSSFAGGIDWSTSGVQGYVGTYNTSATIKPEGKLIFANSNLDVLSTNSVGGLRLYGGVLGAASPSISTIGSFANINVDTNLVMINQSKIAFDSDVTNTYIAADTDNPENLEIHADNNIQLFGDVEANGAITALTISASTGFNGDLEGTASYATTASYVAGANVDGTVGSATLATTALTATNADNLYINEIASGDYGLIFRAGDAAGYQDVYADTEAAAPKYSPATNTLSATIISASTAFNGTLDGNASTATTASYALTASIANTSISASYATTASYVEGIPAEFSEVVTITATNLVIDDANIDTYKGKTILCDSTSSFDFEIDTTTTPSENVEFYLVQYNTAQVAIINYAGNTYSSVGTSPTTRTQYSSMVVKHIGSDNYLVLGDIE